MVECLARVGVVGFGDLVISMPRDLIFVSECIGRTGRSGLGSGEKSRLSPKQEQQLACGIVSTPSRIPSLSY